TTRLPKAGAIAETVRRRRASGGPAESAFATLVGLELRPRRLREAAAMWQQLSDAVGDDKRDSLWSHPDLIPTSDDIDDPSALIARIQGGTPKPLNPYPDAETLRLCAIRRTESMPSADTAMVFLAVFKASMLAGKLPRNHCFTSSMIMPALPRASFRHSLIGGFLAILEAEMPECEFRMQAETGIRPPRQPAVQRGSGHAHTMVFP
ncbi:MAG: zinc-dependent metalloprotease, partial [Fibrobacteria bacterium]